MGILDETIEWLLEEIRGFVDGLIGKIKGAVMWTFVWTLIVVVVSTILPSWILKLALFLLTTALTILSIREEIDEFRTSGFGFAFGALLAYFLMPSLFNLIDLIGIFAGLVLSGYALTKKHFML